MALTDVAGFALAPPPLWPMGIGAGRPRVMERVDGIFSRYELAWDDDGRLAEVRASFQPGRVANRDEYVWRGARLERIRRIDAALEEEGDGLERERVWRYDASDRPIEIRTVWAHSSRQEPIEAWRWSDDGRTVQITESSSQGVLGERTVRFDAAGRLAHVEQVRPADGARRTLELEWSPEGRLLRARERSGDALATERVVHFRWDAAGRLEAQSSPEDPSVDLWAYRYDAAAP